MKNIVFTILFSIISFEAFTQNIGTINFIKIFNQSSSYKLFIDQIEDFKKKNIETFTKEEKILISKKNEIEESKILLSEQEYINKVNEFNDLKIIFDNKIQTYNNIIDNNINNNEKIIIDKVTEIIAKLANEKQIDLVLSEKNYYLSSDKIDLTNEVIEILNKTEIKLNFTINE
ncbi:MAG: hypothetical protein CFH19_01181 [Alphaproteobacteria bacterium MarineAlpha5_Bin9]|nr:MAG: hypothetical protein CFH19_01181 [Alphaproteobacteria bacterium MarineAlpha5_Bin9]